MWSLSGRTKEIRQSRHVLTTAAIRSSDARYAKERSAAGSARNARRDASSSMNLAPCAYPASGMEHLASDKSSLIRPNVAIGESKTVWKHFNLFCP